MNPRQCTKTQLTIFVGGVSGFEAAADGHDQDVALQTRAAASVQANHLHIMHVTCHVTRSKCPPHMHHDIVLTNVREWNWAWHVSWAVSWAWHVSWKPTISQCHLYHLLGSGATSITLPDTPLFY